MEVDALDALIHLALADSGLSSLLSNRIADRHRYGQDTGDWPQDAQALTLSPVPGAVPDVDCGTQVMQVDARCYGDTFFAAGEVYKKLVDFTRHDARRVVTVPDVGEALIYNVTLNGTPRKEMLDEVRPNGGMPAFIVNLICRVAEQTVT